MARRVSMPAADDLFRPTGPDDVPAAADVAPTVGKPKARTAPRSARGGIRAVQTPAEESAEAPAQRKGREASGRIRHDEKMTVYVTSEELLAIEHARLTLRAAHGLAVDRGRLVREAVAVVLADLDEHGEDSMLLRRLRAEAEA